MLRKLNKKKIIMWSLGIGAVIIGGFFLLRASTRRALRWASATPPPPGTPTTPPEYRMRPLPEKAIVTPTTPTQPTLPVIEPPPTEQVGSQEWIEEQVKLWIEGKISDDQIMEILNKYNVQ